MKNDYLWDGSGEPDPELQRIEKSLSQFRYSGEMPNLPAIGSSAQRKPSIVAILTMGWIPRFAAAALLLLALASSLLLLRISSPLVPNAPSWDVARLSGAPRVGQISLASGSNKTQLRVGQLLVTDDASRAAVTVAEIGEVYVDPGSRVRLIETGSDRERLALAPNAAFAGSTAANGGRGGAAHARTHLCTRGPLRSPLRA